MEQQLTLRIEGPGVIPGRIAPGDLQRIVQPLEQAVRALLPVMPSSVSGPRNDDRPQVRFLLSGIESGSAVTSGDLTVEATLSRSMFDDDPLDRLISGLNSEDKQLPARVMRYIERLQRNFPIGVETICVEVSGNGGKATLRPLKQNGACALLEEERSLTGRLMEVNFLAKRAQLEVQRARGGRPTQRISLQFEDELAGDMQRCARQLVSVKGRATLNRTRDVQRLDVSGIALQVDDRRALWPQKKFRWPTPDERLSNVDMAEFLLTSSDYDEDDE